jgi:flavodoxin
MKTAIIYYSQAGNTKKVAEILGGYVKEKSEVEYIELKSQDEPKFFLSQCYRALRYTKAKIAPVNFDLREYVFVCLGTPVWAFGPTPAINAYLDSCSGAADKEIILFTTYGSGTGNSRCLDYMQNILSQKGAKNFRRFSVQQFKANDKEFILSKVKEVL